MLEEIGYNFKVTKVNINKGEQFKESFKKISPFSKIPVIIDHTKTIRLFLNLEQFLFIQQNKAENFTTKKIEQ